MPLSTNGRNACMTGLASVVSHLSLHGGIPDGTGSNELTGGSPAYARKAVSWNAAASGLVDNTAQIVHDVPAGSTVYAVGLWSALSAGNFHGWVPYNGTIRGYGEVDSTGVTNDTIASSGHGLTNGMVVTVRPVLAESLPAGLTQDLIYFVVSAATDTFKVSLTSGGAAVNITGQGELYFASITPEVFASQGTSTIAAGAIDLIEQV
jgi:hypothetical protein